MKSTNPINSKMMKKMMLLGMVLTILLSSCGSPDKVAQLEKLKQQQAEIAGKIKQLEEEISAEGIIHGSDHMIPVKVASLSPSLFAHKVNVQGTIESENNIFIPAQSQSLVTRILVKWQH